MLHETPGPTAADAPAAPADERRVHVPEPACGADGRWRWESPQAPLALAFRTREEALEDRALRAAAQPDATGRGVLPKEHLRKLISAIALPCTSCADVYFGGVYWHPRDASGCNWSVGIMGGSGDRRGCEDCVRAARAELRRRYAIADEA